MLTQKVLESAGWLSPRCSSSRKAVIESRYKIQVPNSLLDAVGFNDQDSDGAATFKLYDCLRGILTRSRTKL